MLFAFGTCPNHIETLGMKKPAGSTEEIEQLFGCESSSLVMVGYCFLDFFGLSCFPLLYEAFHHLANFWLNNRWETVHLRTLPTEIGMVFSQY